MSNNGTKALALKAWEAGFSIIAKRLNAVLVEVAPELRIKAQSPAAEMTSEEESRNLRHAAFELRRLVVLLHGTFEGVTPWTYGYVNDKGNMQLYVSLGNPELYDNIPEFLRTGRPNWRIEHWREFIVDPVEKQASQWRALLGKRQAKRRRTTKGKPLTPKQLEATQAVSECGGNFTEAAKRLGKDRKTVVQHHKAAMDKMGKQAVKHATKAMSTNRRGQQDMAESEVRDR